MNSTNRLLARISSTAVGAVLAGGLIAAPLSVLAAPVASNLWFMGSRLIFTEGRPQSGDLAVSINDPGLRKFLTKLGATVSFQSGQRYLVVTAADRRSITFTIGSAQYQIDGRPQTAPFSAVEEDGDAFVPFYTLARALRLELVQAGNETVLQPQISDVETQVDHGRTVVIFHGAAALHPQMVSGTATRTVLHFPGTASTLEAERDIASPGLGHMSVAVGGTVRNPLTTVTLTSARPAHLGFLPAPDSTSAVLAVAPVNVALHAASSPFGEPQAPRIAPAPAPVAALPVETAPPALTPVQAVTPAPLAPTAIAVTGVTESTSDDHFVVRLAVTGTPNYQWHVMSDGRFFIDIRNADLATAVRDESLGDAHVSALRLRSNGTPTAPNVRLALTLVQSPAIAIASDAAGVTITVGGRRLSYAPRDGAGRIGYDTIASVPAAPPPAPLPVAATLPPELSDGTGAPNWKFAPGTPRGSRIIVLDPGHGGSDTGAQHNGLTEKVLTLDIARRLRTMLIARGWDVRMTRDADVDVYQPNDSAHDELQARCDIANAAGARLFVSIHINSYTSSDLQGTTTYYYHPQDAAFASVVENKLIHSLGTQNDGAQHANFYVIHHTTMPAILVETAFLSNPDDAARLRSATFRQSVASAITDGITTYVSGNQDLKRSSRTDDGDLDTKPSTSLAAPHARPHAESLVRSASSMDDDLSQ